MAERHIDQTETEFFSEVGSWCDEFWNSVDEALTSVAEATIGDWFHEQLKSSQVHGFFRHILFFSFFSIVVYSSLCTARGVFSFILDCSTGGDNLDNITHPRCKQAASCVLLHWVPYPYCCCRNPFCKPKVDSPQAETTPKLPLDLNPAREGAVDGDRTPPAPRGRERSLAFDFGDPLAEGQAGLGQKTGSLEGAGLAQGEVAVPLVTGSELNNKPVDKAPLDSEDQGAVTTTPTTNLKDLKPAVGQPEAPRSNSTFNSTNSSNVNNISGVVQPAVSSQQPASESPTGQGSESLSGNPKSKKKDTSNKSGSSSDGPSANCSSSILTKSNTTRLNTTKFSSLDSANSGAESHSSSLNGTAQNSTAPNPDDPRKGEDSTSSSSESPLCNCCCVNSVDPESTGFRLGAACVCGLIIAACAVGAKMCCFNNKNDEKRGESEGEEEAAGEEGESSAFLINVEAEAAEDLVKPAAAGPGTDGTVLTVLSSTGGAASPSTKKTSHGMRGETTIWSGMTRPGGHAVTTVNLTTAVPGTTVTVGANPLLSGKNSKGPSGPLLSGKKGPSSLLSGKKGPSSLLSGKKGPSSLLSGKKGPSPLILSGKKGPSGPLLSGKKGPSSLLSGKKGPNSQLIVSGKKGPAAKGVTSLQSKAKGGGSKGGGKKE